MEELRPKFCVSLCVQAAMTHYMTLAGPHARFRDEPIPWHTVPRPGCEFLLFSPNLSPSSSHLPVYATGEISHRFLSFFFVLCIPLLDFLYASQEPERALSLWLSPASDLPFTGSHLVGRERQCPDIAMVTPLCSDCPTAFALFLWVLQDLSKRRNWYQCTPHEKITLPAVHECTVTRRGGHGGRQVIGG